LNETWTIYGRGLNNFEARIFNSWGEELYLFNSVDKGWNGNRLNGTACPQGVYVYKVFITDNKGDVHEFYGNLNLIR
jgi:gliding motility-associated-like protein